MTSAKLIIRSPGRPNREVRLAGGVSIGRAFDNVVRVEVDGVSRYHAIIEQRDDGFWLSDLGSRNGTAVNGAVVTGALKLENGDLLELGSSASVEFLLTREQPSAATAGTQEQSEPNPSPEKPGPQDNSGIRRALYTGLAILVVVIGAFVLARLLTPTQSSAGDGKTSGNAIASMAGKDSSDGNPPPPVTSPAGPDTPSVDPGSSQTVPKVEPSLDDVRRMCERLADPISGKSNSVFEIEMVTLVRQRANDYRDYRSEAAERYRQDINAAFGRQGLPRLLGFVTAMSRTKFKPVPISEGAVGLWRMPKTIARGYLLSDDSETAFVDPKQSADIAARYMKELLVAFSGNEDFMYALACFGMTLENASEVKGNLDRLAPSSSPDRHNFWKMFKRGVVTDEQAKTVIDFFAAGIVGANPESFDLRTKSLDALYFS